MPSQLSTDLPAIALAVETQLTTFISTVTGTPVCGEVSNIYWCEEGETPPPGVTGQRDVLLIFRNDNTEGSVVGGGRQGSWISSGMDLNLRSTLALDRFGTKKDFFISNRNLVNGLMDAMMGFFPVDQNSNSYTIEGFVLDTNSSPGKVRDAATWGYTVSSYRFHYRPRIDHSIIG